MDAGVNPTLAARCQHTLVHSELLGILAVEFGHLAKREGEIGRADIDCIDPPHIQDVADAKQLRS